MGLARRDSPFRGGRYLGLAQALTSELPATLAALRAGDTSEWRATLVARETACLDPADRRVADAELGPTLAGLGDREVEAAARAVAYRLDPRAFVDRAQGAAKDRTVTLRPAPDTMSRFCGFLPVAQGVATYAALSPEADRRTADGDRRSRARSWPTPWSSGSPDSRPPARCRSRCSWSMPADTLLAGGDEPGDLAGAGPVPAGAARALVSRPGRTVWLRRVYARPADGALVAMDSKRRRFPTGLRRLLQVRDRTCRTPWCGAPIRHTDHVIPSPRAARRPPRTGKGLCEACNYTKQAPGWRARPGPAGAGDRVEITTPTGHTYTSHPPPLPGARAPERRPKPHRGTLPPPHPRRLRTAAGPAGPRGAVRCGRRTSAQDLHRATGP